MQRRLFIKQSGLAVAATALLPNLFYGCDKGSPLGLQLYSLRESIGDDVRGTIEKVAKVGFKEVETYGYSPDNKFWGFSVAEFKDMIHSNGMTTPSGHYSLDPYLSKDGTDADFATALEVAQGLDQKYLVIPHISEALRTSIDDYKRMAEKLNRAGEMCKDAGLKLAYHNHAFEFDDFNGENGLQVFLENTDEDLVDFELDIYWVVRAGIDPVALFEKYPGRFPLWHVKDMSKSNNEMNTEIGSGSIDYNKVFKKAKLAGGKHFIVEQENFEMDPYESLSQSYNYIKSDLLNS
ncbi:sugar phosphate isomerase/epimerase [Salegentibacter sp. JZCK2]|uniref:sugar phosphate isomerase/epimerase family protein n=1 Tax=Salegentibacter tibetensis TaxID=2873600 RepID=UPI001CCA84A2|nr:sugar phosphate isomerase/epimerase [Salegentibacter tibetensis]MBZ9730073.1 sugar phosphate isomerase/epimerase [Salegentibacter tibetensis]